MSDEKKYFSSLMVNGEKRYVKDEEAQEKIESLQYDIDSKQDLLTPGNNITIEKDSEGNTIISASNGTIDYNELINKPSINNVVLEGSLSLEDLGIQGELSSENAGQGIDIFLDSEGKVIISNTQTSAEWGNITGDINDQVDLMNLFDRIDSIMMNIDGHIVSCPIIRYSYLSNDPSTEILWIKVDDGTTDGRNIYLPSTAMLIAAGQELNTKIETKQDILTQDNAGAGIAIDYNSDGNVVISNTNVSAEWGNIQGNIIDQTDLIEHIKGTPIYAIPFTSEGIPSISRQTTSYYKLTSESLTSLDIHFLSGRELINLLNDNDQCYILLIDLIPVTGAFLPVPDNLLRFKYFYNLDGILGKYMDIPGSIDNSYSAFFWELGVNRDYGLIDKFYIQLNDIETFDVECKGYLTNYGYTAGNGIILNTSTPGVNSVGQFKLDDLILECGTSTINV